MEEKEQKFGFLHIPRTAGGSIVNELVKTDWVVLGHDETSEHYLHIKDYRVYNEKDNTYVITTIRNPYDRLVSAYFYLMAGGDNSKDQLDKEIYLSSFKSFEEFVLKGLHWFRRKKMLKQIHFRPQNYWMIDKSRKVLVDKIFNFENLDELFEFIAKNSQIKVEEIMHVHASKRTHFEDYYSKKMKKIVYNTYRSDFKLFNYKE